MVDILEQIAFRLYDFIKNEKKVSENVLYENSNNNENWHSRILRMLLEYREENYYPILDSFIQLLNKEAEVSITEIKRKTQLPQVRCYNEWEHIDILIRIDNDAIIIENKINWAIDQERQIERYVQSVKTDSDASIYVVYLTFDGSKIVSDCSLTDTAKSQIEYNHYIPLNYKYHILPWLKDKVLSFINSENSILYSSLVLYINYLENMFKQQDNSQITNIILEEMKEKGVDMSNLENCFNAVTGAVKLLEKLNKIKEEKIKEIAIEHIKTPLELYLKNKDMNLDKADFCLDYFNIWISHNNWKKCQIHLGVWQYKNYGGLQYKEADIKLSLEAQKQINDIFPDWKGDNNEPKWIYFDKKFRDYYNIETWKSIENGDFEKYIETFIDNILDRVKDVEL